MDFSREPALRPYRNRRDEFDSDRRDSSSYYNDIRGGDRSLKKRRSSKTSSSRSPSSLSSRIPSSLLSKPSSPPKSWPKPSRSSSPSKHKRSFAKLYNKHIGDVRRAANAIQPNLITRSPTNITGLTIPVLLEIFDMSQEELIDYVNKWLNKKLDYYQSSLNISTDFKRIIVDTDPLFEKDKQLKSRILELLRSSEETTHRMWDQVKTHQMNVFFGAILRFIHEEKNEDLVRIYGTSLRNYYDKNISKKLTHVKSPHLINVLSSEKVHNIVKSIPKWTRGEKIYTWKHGLSPIGSESSESYSAEGGVTPSIKRIKSSYLDREVKKITGLSDISNINPKLFLTIVKMSPLSYIDKEQEILNVLDLEHLRFLKSLTEKRKYEQDVQLFAPRQKNTDDEIFTRFSELYYSSLELIHELYNRILKIQLSVFFAINERIKRDKDVWNLNIRMGVANYYRAMKQTVETEYFYTPPVSSRVLFNTVSHTIIPPSFNYNQKQVTEQNGGFWKRKKKKESVNRDALTALPNESSEMIKAANKIMSQYLQSSNNHNKSYSKRVLVDTYNIKDSFDQQIQQLLEPKLSEKYTETMKEISNLSRPILYKYDPEIGVLIQDLSSNLMKRHRIISSYQVGAFYASVVRIVEDTKKIINPKTIAVVKEFADNLNKIKTVQSDVFVNKILNLPRIRSITVTKSV